MKIRLMSDLHREFGKYKIVPMPDDKDTVLVLAGDIDIGLSAKNWICQIAENFKAIIYVMGNHEFYYQDMPEVIARWTMPNTLPANVHVLHNDIIHINDVAFLGTTLWTDLKNNDWFEVYQAREGITDFQVVRFNGKRYTTTNHIDMHREAKKFLNYALPKAPGKKVVVTHFLPTEFAIDPMYVNAPLNSFYAANCDNLIMDYQPDLWLFGHTHENVDKWIGNTRLVCNPRGYYGHCLNRNFNPELVLEV